MHCQRRAGGQCAPIAGPDRIDAAHVEQQRDCRTRHHERHKDAGESVVAPVTLRPAERTRRGVCCGTRQGRERKQRGAHERKTEYEPRVAVRDRRNRKRGGLSAPDRLVRGMKRNGGSGEDKREPLEHVRAARIGHPSLKRGRYRGKQNDARCDRTAEHQAGGVSHGEHVSGHRTSLAAR